MARKKVLPAGMRYIEKRKCIEFRFTFEGKRCSVYGRTAKECYQKAEAKENSTEKIKDKATANEEKEDEE